MKDINIIAKQAGEKPICKSIPNTLKAMQQLVNGRIETLTIAQNLVVVCNGDGRSLDLPYNCTLFGVNFFGTIFLVGADERGDFADVPLTLEDAKQYGFI